MSWKYKKILEVLGLRSRAPPPRVFVSLNVFNAHRPTRSTHSSTRVIARVSIWTLLVLLLSFMIVYTFLLLYVDNTFLQESSIRNHGKYRKLKLTGRLKMLTNKVIKNEKKDAVENLDTIHRKAVWNSSKFFNEDMNLPHCKWQAVFRILITSSPKSRYQRQAIRNTWCNPEKFGESLRKWHCIFLIGMSEDEKVNTKIRKESEVHNDILFGNYFDAYENLTLKVVHGFNWSIHYCPSSYIVKTDEDCFVNAAQIHDFLVFNNKMTHNLYAGSVTTDKRKLKVVRQKNQKWYVPYKDFSEEYYYPYASGMGYILSKDVAEKIVKESAFIKPIVNEDAYIGIVIHQLGIKPTKSSRFVLSSFGLNVCNYIHLFVIHDVLPDSQKDLLDSAVRARSECDMKSAITTWS